MGHDRYRGWLAIPYLDKDDNPLTIRFRRPDWVSMDGPKYFSLPHDTARVFNVKAIHEAGDEISICEGEFDAIVLGGLGIPAVALPGATNWRAHHRRMLAGFNRIWVWGDSDAAGQEMVAKIVSSMPRSARGVRLPHKDVTEVFLKEGEETLRGLIA